MVRSIDDYTARKMSFKFPYSQLVPFGPGSARRGDLRLCQTRFPSSQHPNATSTELAERTSFQGIWVTMVDETGIRKRLESAYK
jgi:hypothetical protein